MAGAEELAMMNKIVDKMTKDLDLRAYHNGHKERIEAPITSKMKGEVAQVKEEKPKKPAAKSMMEMLRETAESLKCPCCEYCTYAISARGLIYLAFN